MKVILNKDLPTLGEEGDVKDVAKGYARNYLFPRGIALPYNPGTIKLFESRRDEIEARKAAKRQEALSLKEKLEALTLSLVMPAGANGKLYGAVTAQTIVDELAKQGFQVERKRIDIPGNTVKSTGTFKFSVKLYESAAAECAVSVEGQPLKTEAKAPPARGRRRQETETVKNAEAEAPAEPSAETENAAAETPAEPPAETDAAGGEPDASAESSEE
ncbi:MAG: 50S ribosomal protein L9 [Treponema sp.]|jgi:large subunit ribosomal protein L9|nr:50S ribosomal protein L9 [Treponema sp.]